MNFLCHLWVLAVMGDLKSLGTHPPNLLEDNLLLASPLESVPAAPGNPILSARAEKGVAQGLGAVKGH
jgi:hypothetical protein